MSEEEIQNMLAVNRSINDMEQNFRKKLEDLQQRIDKAIKYIIECTQYDLEDNTCEDCEKDILINILRGEK